MADLPYRLNSHLKKLRQADSQASAVAWMTAAYKLMEEAIEELKQKPVTSTIERLIFVPEERKIEVVQAIPKEVLPVVHRLKPEVFGKAWTHQDTHRLEKHSPWKEAALIRYDAPPMPPEKPLPLPEPLKFDGARRNATIMRKLQLIQRKGR